MKARLFTILSILVVLSLLIAACGPTATPEVKPTDTAGAEVTPAKIVVIGKSVHPYWSNVEKGALAAGDALGVETIFFVPPKEDVAAQIQTMETYIAQGVTGIAIAPSDPNALEATMKKAADAGIFVTTLDTPPIEGSVSLVYIGTNNFSAGKTAGDTMVTLLPDGGKVGIGRGSDTALNALQRTDGFLEGIKANPAIVALEPVNDKEDAATALQLANSVISANPDLAGAFGVYAYNGPAWATAIKEADAVGKIKLVCFDATTDIINGIKEGVIDATVAQREFDMGYKSVEIIKAIAEKGTDAALSEMGAVDGVIDTGVDVITAATLKDYEAGLDKKGIPHEWNTEGWTPPSGGAAVPEKLVIAWIPKALNNPVFEVGSVGAVKKAEELTAAGPIPVEVNYVGSVASDAAEQARVMEDAVAAGANAVGISCNDPTACEDPINKAVAAGVPVMTWDSDSPNSQRFTYLGVDNYQGGKAAAELLIKFMGEKGKVALLTGVPGAFNLEERIRGFKDVVAEYPGIEIVTTVPCNDDINLGVQVVEETMQANPDLNGWFFVGLWPLFAERGSMPLWEDAALNKGLVTISFDTLEVELGFMKDGYVQGLVGQKYWGWGYDTVQMIYDYIVNGTRYESWTDSGMDIVTKCNVDVMAEAWANSDFTKPLPDPYECLGEAPAPAALSGELEIFSWWTAGGEADGLNAMYKVFSAQYPDVEIINATVAGGAGSNAKAVLATRMQADDPPDSFQVHAGHELIDSWVKADKMEPVTSIFEANGWLDKYPQGVIDILSYDGEIWSVPVNIHRSNVLWYNKKVFADNGLTAPTTFDEFFTVAEALKAKGVTPLALGDKDIWTATHLMESVLLGTLGPDKFRGLWDGSTDWNGAEVTQALETFAKMVGYVNEDHAALSWDQAAQLVADGSAAMTIMGDWAEGYFKSIGQTPDVEFGYVPSPATAGSFIMLSDSFGLPKGAPDRDNAVAWLTLCGSKEGQDAFNPLKGSIPARTDGDRALYDIYLQSAMDDFGSNEIVPSLPHGAAAAEGWVTDFNNAMTLFVSDLDVAAAQTAMAQACVNAGVCK